MEDHRYRILKLLSVGDRKCLEPHLPWFYSNQYQSYASKKRLRILTFVSDKGQGLVGFSSHVLRLCPEKYQQLSSTCCSVFPQKETGHFQYSLPLFPQQPSERNMHCSCYPFSDRDTETKSGQSLLVCVETRKQTLFRGTSFSHCEKCRVCGKDVYGRQTHWGQTEGAQIHGRHKCCALDQECRHILKGRFFHYLCLRPK